MYVHVQVLLVFQNTTVSVHVPHVPENTKIPYCRFQNNPQVFIMYLHQQCMYVLFWYLRNTAGSRIDLESNQSTFLRLYLSEKHIHGRFGCTLVIVVRP